MVANGLLPYLQEGDEIVISEADHHANFVTWHAIAQKCGAQLRVLPITDDWLIDQNALLNTLNSKTKLVALNYVSNVTGTEQPVAHLIELVRRYSNALVLVDAAQAVSHISIDLQQLGVLSGKLAALERLQPLQYGGKMIERVSAQQISFAELPYRLEAGTPNIAAVIGFNAVLEWLERWDFIAAEQQAVALAEQAKVQLKNYPFCKLFNSPKPSSVVCFVFEGIACSDLATLLAEQNIALRSGVHCAQPYLARLGQSATLRLSFAPYNTSSDLDAFFNALDKSLMLLAE